MKGDGPYIPEDREPIRRVNPHRRLEGENFTLTIPLGQRHHEFTLTIARDENDIPREVAFIGRGIVGQGLDQFLVELGLQISRAMQRRDPATGEPIA